MPDDLRPDRLTGAGAGPELTGHIGQSLPSGNEPAAATSRGAGPAPPIIAGSLNTLVQTAGQPSLFAHSDFVKQVECARCGAPKRLPSRAAYLYCDHCGALVDYDFRLANSGTNAGLTNTVYHQLIPQAGHRRR